jgi:ABC-type transport system involved in cytochrome bd biosynthesis fused ATPase/permease subunit
MIDKLSHYFCRTLFGVSIALLVVAVLEEALGFLGWTLTFISYEPGRLLEISATFIIFVIALLLRQIRENTSK